MSPPPDPSLTRRRAVRASLVGTIVEYYEFTVYGFLAVVFGPLFFPAGSPTVATLSALTVFGAGYLARPLGGVVFGALGDRYGRRPVLMATLLIMGVASSLMGILPTYASIGAAAPVLLLILRLLQGFSAGGEWSGALTYITEMAPPRRRGLYGSVPALGVGIGFLSAALLVALVAGTGVEMSTWGWRIPFLVCIPLTVLCVALRYKLEDSPEFKAIAHTAEGVSRIPVRETIRSHPRDVLSVAALTIGVLGPSILGKLYVAVHLVQIKGFPAQEVYLLLGLTLLATVWIFPVMGMKSDAIGRRPIAWIGLSASVILPVPLFLAVDAADSILAVAPALLIYLLVEPFVSGAVFAGFAELFPTRTRFTGVSIGLNLGTIATAGFGPAIATWLVTATGWAGSPGLWGSACALIGLGALAVTHEADKLSNREVHPS
ncbi:MFS transporter [Kribbella sp. NPDC056861]|uniref:MFS transporter n=1 Tax=Kribbella sp. NPDC056861 TaxID=3154857 RepID=UPI003419580D